MVQAINGVGPGISLVLRLTVHGMNAGQTNAFQVQVSQCNRMKEKGERGGGHVKRRRRENKGIRCCCNPIFIVAVVCDSLAEILTRPEESVALNESTHW